MKRIVVIAAAAVAMVAGTALADAPFGGAKDAKADAAAVKKAKPKPKKPSYMKLKPAKDAAAEWNQPVLTFFLKKNDDDSTNLKRKVINRKELKTFFSDNFVMLVIEIPTDRNGNPDAKLLGKEEAKLFEDAKTDLGGIELPATVVVNAKGEPKAKVGKYVLDVGVGAWLPMMEAALKTAGYKEATMTKEAQKLVDENKPDGKAKVQKDKK